MLRNEVRNRFAAFLIRTHFMYCIVVRPVSFLNSCRSLPEERLTLIDKARSDNSSEKAVFTTVIICLTRRSVEDLNTGSIALSFTWALKLFTTRFSEFISFVWTALKPEAVGVRA